MKQTTDIWFATFLMDQGKEVVDYSRKTNGRYIFIFGDINDEEWKKLKFTFKASPASRLKYLQEQLKDLVS